MGKGRKRSIRKSHLKRFASHVINAGQGIDKRYIERFKSNGRTYGRVFQGPLVDLQDNGLPLLPRIIHPDPLPERRSHITEHGTYVPGQTPERIAVEKRIRQERLHQQITIRYLLGNGSTKTETLERVLLHGGFIAKVWMYHGSGRFIFVEETKRTYRASIQYTSRDSAMHAFKRERITWVEVLAKKEATDASQS